MLANQDDVFKGATEGGRGEEERVALQETGKAYTRERVPGKQPKCLNIY